MNREDHRLHSIAAFQAYEQDDLPERYSIRISELSEKQLIDAKAWEGTVYFLRLDLSRTLDSSVLAIPNRADAKNILYIGGHEKLHGTRYNELIRSCRKSQAHFESFGFAKNDQNHPHPVAGCFTTSLLETGFRVQDCILDVVSGLPKYNELEFIIGYQEKYHQLPPWNSNRKGKDAFSQLIAGAGLC